MRDSRYGFARRGAQGSPRDRSRPTPLFVLLAVGLLLSGCISTPIAGRPAIGAAANTSAGRALAPSAAPDEPSPASSAANIPVTRIVTLTTADGTRFARVHHPASARAGAALVVVLHPAGTSAADMEANFGWDAVADREGIVVAYPDGLLDSYQDTWNGGRCCPPASEMNTDDVGFIDTMTTDLRRTDDLGSTVYAVGFSNGAILAYAWACARPGTLTGIGIVAGALMINCPQPAPVTVVAVHGTADPSIPIAGGPAPGGNVFPSLEKSLQPFLTAAQCPGKSVDVATTAARVSTWTCAGGRRIVSDVVTGLGHAWPGAGAEAGKSTAPTDATGFVWARLRSSAG